MGLPMERLHFVPNNSVESNCRTLRCLRHISRTVGSIDLQI